MFKSAVRKFQPFQLTAAPPLNCSVRPPPLYFSRHINTSQARMAAQPTPSAQEISSVAKQEGGPQQGSESARMQSQVGKEQNFERTAQDIMQKMQTDPSSITPEDANHLKSREARATGQAQPPKDSISADAQRLASANERGDVPSSGPGPLSPQEQSHITKENNFADAVNKIGQKSPEQITKEDADLLHRREQRAHGHTEKGGVAAQAQHLASENASKGTA